MACRPHATVLAIALCALLAPAARADDLLQSYQKARTSDPVFAAAESGHLATIENPVQARAAMLPQVSAQGTLRRTQSEGPATQTQFDPVTGAPVVFNGDIKSTTNSRNTGIDGSQMLFDRARQTQLRSARANARASVSSWTSTLK